MTTKDTNPKDAVGCRKPPMSTVPCGPMAEVGVALLEGACKYGRHNYRAAGVRASIYYDAVLRHLMAWWEGEDIDPDSGLSHVTKAIAGLFVLRDSQMQGNWSDDRPPKSASWRADLQSRVDEILARYPNPLPPHVAVGGDGGNGLPPSQPPLHQNCRSVIDTCEHEFTNGAHARGPQRTERLTSVEGLLRQHPEGLSPQAIFDALPGEFGSIKAVWNFLSNVVDKSAVAKVGHGRYVHVDNLHQKEGVPPIAARHF